MYICLISVFALRYGCVFKMQRDEALYKLDKIWIAKLAGDVEAKYGKEAK